MLIEVVISAMLLALIVVGAFTGFDASGHESAQLRDRAIANQLAIQDEEHLRGAQVTDLNSINGSSWSTTVNGTVFTITRSAVLENSSGSVSACSASGGSPNVDYVETTSSVTWHTMPAGAQPVTQSSYVTPPNGGGLVVEVGDVGSFDSNGVAGGAPTQAVLVTVQSLSGGSSSITKTAVTNLNGCAAFIGLPDGSYQVTLQGTGDETVDGVSNPVYSPVSVTTGLTTTEIYVYTAPGSIAATFQSTDPATGDTFTGARADSIVAVNTSITPVTAQAQTFMAGSSLGPANFSTQITTGQLFPFNYEQGGNPPINGQAYTVYAGSCTADNPGAFGAPSVPTATLLPGQQQAPLHDSSGNPLYVTVPPLKLIVYQGSSGSTYSTVTPTKVVVTDTGCSSPSSSQYVTRTYTSTAGQLVQPSSGGVAGTLANPDLPYGNYLVCATIGGGVYLATTKAGGTNTTLTNGSTTGVSGYIYTGAPYTNFPSGYSQSKSC